MSDAPNTTTETHALTSPADPLNVPKPVVEEPVTTEPEPEAPASEPEPEAEPDPEGDDDFSDLFDFAEDDDEPEAEPETPKPDAKAKPSADPEPDEDLDYDDPAVVRALHKKVSDLEAKLNERETREARAAMASAEERLAGEVDSAVKDFKLTKVELKEVLRYAKDRDLFPNIVTGKLAFGDVVGFARPDIAARAKPASTPANGTPSNGKPPAAPKPKQPAQPSNAAPSSTFSDATVSASRDARWIGKLTGR